MSRRRRGRITVQHQPTGGEQMMRRGMGIVHAIFGGVFALVAVAEIIPNAGLFGLPFLAAGVFFLINGIRIAVTKNDFAHRVGYDVETDLEQSIAGLMEDVPDTTGEPVERNAPAPSVGPDPKTRLEQLETLKSAGLITKAEYDEKRREILEEL